MIAHYRTLALAAALIASPAAAIAQEHASPTGLGPFQFGMDVHAARAAVPGAEWNEGQFAADGVELSGASLQLGESTLFARLLFWRERPARVELHRVSRTRDAAQCFGFFVATVTALERSLGPLSGSANPAGELVAERTTGGGSRLRLYRNVASDVYVVNADGALPETVDVGLLAPPGDGDLPRGCIQYANVRAPDAFFASSEAPFVAPGAPIAEVLAAADPIERPVWPVTPSPDQMMRAYPPAALHLGVSGHVSLTCLVAVQGTLQCAITSETPTGIGFAQSALSLASTMRIETRINGARTRGQRVEVHMPFVAAE